LTNSLSQATVVAYGFATGIPGNVGHLCTLPCPGNNKSIRAGKGNLFVGFCCRLPSRGHRRVDWKHEKEFFFCTNHAGMSLKTKDRCGKRCEEAGMSLITKEIISESGNVIENKEDHRSLKAARRTCCRPLRPPLTGPFRVACHAVILSGAKNLALDFSARRQQGEMLRCAQHDSEPALSRAS
jgi:hypothetical protein